MINNNKAFTLIEIIIFIIVFSLGVVAIVTMFSNLVGKSSDPTIRLKTIQVSQAIMDEIMSRKWDENTPNGGGTAIPTDVGNLGKDINEDTIDDFDDVDDYLSIDGCNTSENSSDCFKIKGNYLFNIKLSYGNYNNTTKQVEKTSGTGNYKIIEISITSGLLNETISLYAIKGNF